MTRAESLRRIIDGKAKPLGSLGRIEELAILLGCLQDTDRPSVRDPVLLVFAADHGAVASGISAYPSAVTAAMVGVYLQGRAAANLFARQAGTRMIVVDAGVTSELPRHPGLLSARIGPGTQDWVHGPAMNPAEVQAALDAAGDIVDVLVNGGSTVLALGDMGIGNTASAALLVHKVAGLDLDGLVGRGAGLDDAGLRQKREAVAHGAARTAARLTAAEALSEYGGYEIAMLVGGILQGARRRVCVVIDGVIVTAAAVLAHALSPSCLECCVFGHRSAERGHDAMLTHLGVTPLLDLGLRLGEGTGAALAIPLLQAAAAMLSDMADLREVT